MYIHIIRQRRVLSCNLPIPIIYVVINIYIYSLTINCRALAEKNCDEPKCPKIPKGVTESKTTLLPVPWDCKQYIICQRGVLHYR